jgi:hypothetical protein
MHIVLLSWFDLI